MTYIKENTSWHKFRVRDPWTKSYFFNWITIDEALRTKTAFLPQDVVYELISDIKDINWKFVCQWDVVKRKRLRAYARWNWDLDKVWKNDIKVIFWEEDWLFIYPHWADDEAIIEIIWNINQNPEFLWVPNQ
jgi:hypothetical protein